MFFLNSLLVRKFGRLGFSTRFIFDLYISLSLKFHSHEALTATIGSVCRRWGYQGMWVGFYLWRSLRKRTLWLNHHPWGVYPWIWQGHCYPTRRESQRWRSLPETKARSVAPWGRLPQLLNRWCSTLFVRPHRLACLHGLGGVHCLQPSCYRSWFLCIIEVMGFVVVVLGMVVESIMRCGKRFSCFVSSLHVGYCIYIFPSLL
jgi:hypothetical protein